MSERRAETLSGGLAEHLDARFRGPLMSFFLRRTRDRDDAEDLTQEVFMRLLRIADPERIEDVDAFVFKVARNLLADRDRRSVMTRGTLSIDEGLVDEIIREYAETRTPDRVLVARETLSELLEVLGELGERTRDIYILFRLDRMKQRDIAALYGIAQSTVEKNVMRATLHLMTRLGLERDGHAD